MYRAAIPHPSKLSGCVTARLLSSPFPPSPFGFPVEGRPDSDLMHELQWYLEKFLEYPFSPETDHAARVQKALCDWGEQTFQALFGNRASGRMFDAATAEDYSDLHLQISSDDPKVMSWPWEAVRDPELGVLAHTCQIERRLNAVRDPQELPQSLPKDRVNILLVVARPYGKTDVRFPLGCPVAGRVDRERKAAGTGGITPPTDFREFARPSSRASRLLSHPALRRARWLPGGRRGQRRRVARAGGQAGLRDGGGGAGSSDRRKTQCAAEGVCSSGSGTECLPVGHGGRRQP